MPNYRSINITLHSQFDAQVIPEYYPPIRKDSSPHHREGQPPFVDDATSTCSVFVPFLPGSAFWIAYAVSPPVPDGHLFLFKLYVNGAHIVNWAADKQAAWKGKTMFGLYESEEDEQGRKRVEKRALCFSPKHNFTFDETTRVEIKVHRAKGRKRIEREMQRYSETEHAMSGSEIKLVNAGRAGANQPKRFYKYALIDPVDQPFITFRYYYRTWDQLREMGVLEDDRYDDSQEDDLPVIEPLDGDSTDTDSSSESEESSRDGFRNSSVASLSPQKSINTGGDKQLKYGHICTSNSPERHRFPPIRLVTPEIESKPLPPSPQWATSFNSYSPHPAHPEDDCAVSTPKTRRLPSMEKYWGRNRSVSSLMKSMSSTWKRQKQGGEMD